MYDSLCKENEPVSIVNHRDNERMSTIMKKIQKKEMAKNIGLVALGVVCTIILIMLIDVTAQSRNRMTGFCDSEIYSGNEQLLLMQVREVLNDAGIDQAGIMLTYIEQAGKEREYTLSVNHNRLSLLTDSEREALIHSILKCNENANGEHLLQTRVKLYYVQQ